MHWNSHVVSGLRFRAPGRTPQWRGVLWRQWDEGSVALLSSVPWLGLRANSFWIPVAHREIHEGIPIEATLDFYHTSVTNPGYACGRFLDLPALYLFTNHRVFCSSGIAFQKEISLFANSRVSGERWRYELVQVWLISVDVIVSILWV